MPKITVKLGASSRATCFYKIGHVPSGSLPPCGARSRSKLLTKLDRKATYHSAMEESQKCGWWKLSRNKVLHESSLCRVDPKRVKRGIKLENIFMSSMLITCNFCHSCKARAIVRCIHNPETFERQNPL